MALISTRKGASASLLRSPSGAAGVALVETKKGKPKVIMAGSLPIGTRNISYPFMQADMLASTGDTTPPTLEAFLFGA